MRRPLVLPAALGFLACSATAAALALGAESSRIERVPAAIAATTTTPSLLEPSTSTTVPPGDPSGIGALLTNLDGVWSQTRQPSSSCLMVEDHRHVVFERNPDVAVTPASTMKLLTATATLATIAPSERLRTPVLATAPPHEGVVNGDLFLVGGGDPV